MENGPNRLFMPKIPLTPYPLPHAHSDYRAPDLASPASGPGTCLDGPRPSARSLSGTCASKTSARPRAANHRPPKFGRPGFRSPCPPPCVDGETTPAPDARWFPCRRTRAALPALVCPAPWSPLAPSPRSPPARPKGSRRVPKVTASRPPTYLRHTAVLLPPRDVQLLQFIFLVV
jgi:hypothetical protein